MVMVDVFEPPTLKWKGPHPSNAGALRSRLASGRATWALRCNPSPWPAAEQREGEDRVKGRTIRDWPPHSPGVAAGSSGRTPKGERGAVLRAAPPATWNAGPATRLMWSSQRLENTFVTSRYINFYEQVLVHFRMIFNN